MSVYTTVFAGSTPIGGLVTGAVASGFGAATAVVLGGAASLIAGVTAMRLITGDAIRARRAQAAADRAQADADAAGLAAGDALEGARPG